MATSPMEKVTNNSGSDYCKMPDGTLIQWGRVSVTTGSTKADLGYNGYSIVSFPIDFNSIPVVLCSPEENAGYWNASATYISKTLFAAYIAGNQQNTSKNVMWVAIGRWK